MFDKVEVSVRTSFFYVASSVKRVVKNCHFVIYWNCGNCINKMMTSPSAYIWKLLLMFAIHLCIRQGAPFGDLTHRLICTGRTASQLNLVSYGTVALRAARVN